MFIFVFLPALAKAEGIRLEEVVVSAARMPEPIEETTSDVIVIKAEDIEKTGAEFLPDVLRQVPELNVVQSGGDGTLASVFLRGGASAHTLVMLDGVKLNGSTTGMFDFSGISVQDIERIEIVKGPQSTLYGSEAMSGVINIITKKGTGRPKTDVSLDGGSFSTYKASVASSMGEGGRHYRLGASYFKTDGISAAKSGQEDDGYKNASLSWRLGWKPSETSSVDVSGRYSYDRSELDGFDFMSGLAADDPNFVQGGNHLVVSVKGSHYISRGWEQSVSASTVKDTLRFTDPDTEFNNYLIINKTKTVDWQHNFYASDSFAMTTGIEYREEEGENAGNFSEKVDNKALYFLGKTKTAGGALVLNAGLRYDDHETAGSETTYRMGAAVNLKDAGIGLRTSYGTGFRAPSLNDLYFPFYGNVSLKPEESASFEAGVSKSFMDGGVSFSVTYFKQEYENLIQTDPATWSAVNIGEAEVEGVETDALIRLGDSVVLTAGYTYLDTEDKATGERLPRRPKEKINSGIRFSSGPASLAANFAHVGERLDTAGKGELHSYRLLDLSGSYKVKEGLALFARAENLFDEDYEEALGYGTKGRSFMGGLRVSY